MWHPSEVVEEDHFKAFEGTCLGTAKIENSGVFPLEKVGLIYRSISACLYYMREVSSAKAKVRRGLAAVSSKKWSEKLTARLRPP